MRPCKQQHDHSPDTCKICNWCADASDTGRAYRRLWDEPESDGKPIPLSKPCVHLGGYTEALAACEGCGPRVRLKTLACALHGQCTEDRQAVLDVNGVKTRLACCKTCPDKNIPLAEG